MLLVLRLWSVRALAILNVLGLLKRKQVGGRSFWLIRLLLHTWISSIMVLRLFICLCVPEPEYRFNDGIFDHK
jgi:hypothetical protein